MLVRRTIAWAIGGIAVIAALFCVWRMSQPFDVEIRLNEASIHNDNLPPLKNAVVTMELENETKIDTLASIESKLVFNNIPQHFMNRPVHMTVSCQNFLDLDTTIVLSPSVSLGLRRDPSIYGNVRFRFWNPDNETTAPNAQVRLAGVEAVANTEGYVNMFIPLERQQRYYLVETELPLANDTLHMPCGGFEMIELK